MPGEERFSTKVLVGALTAVVFPLILLALTKHFWPDKSPSPPVLAPNVTTLPASDGKIPQTKTPAPSDTYAPVMAKKSVPQSVVMDYHALQHRFLAVEGDLKDRFKDVGTQGIKPSILSDIETCRTDLSAAKDDINHGDTEAVQQRLERARQALSRLEAL